MEGYIIATLVLCFVGMAIAFAIGLGWNWQKTLHKLLRTPLKYKTNISNEKEIKQIISMIPKLTLDEQDLILTIMFGRAAKIGRGRSTDGKNWLEYVIPMNEENESIPSHLSQQEMPGNEIG